MADRKSRHSLLSKYKALAKQRGMSVSLNAHVEQWAADSLIESYTLETCYEMLEYYFRVSQNPDWKWFSYNAEKIYKNLTAQKEDDRIRALMRDKAKEWLEN